MYSRFGLANTINTGLKIRVVQLLNPSYKIWACFIFVISEIGLKPVFDHCF